MDDNDLYTDGPEATSSPKEGSTNGDHDAKGGAQEAILPKSIFMGHKCEVGDKYPVEVTGIHGDEVRVKLAKEASDASEPGESAAEPDSDPELSSMME